MKKILTVDIKITNENIVIPQMFYLKDLMQFNSTPDSIL